MILVDTNWPSFEAYLAALSKPARKNFKAVTKHYANLQYWHQGMLNTEELRHFMRLWERQLIRGKNVQWAFPVEHVIELFDKREMEIFSVRDPDTRSTIGMQFIQKRNGFWECHPPMYDKIAHPSLAKYMWFHLIAYSITQHWQPLDLGGGSDEWRDMLKRRAEYPNGRYKWIYVPEKAKGDPDSEPDYSIDRKTCTLLRNS